MMFRSVIKGDWLPSRVPILRLSPISTFFLTYALSNQEANVRFSVLRDKYLGDRAVVTDDARSALKRALAIGDWLIGD
ncbi:hypothetical protein AUJ46_04455 [Candidatus Peregrinibacteria bacterium CG1_02_54_53]|nr:MAG: hypothetical protein AUJ46_04455 [Candidatus Peregrinibacteria bacterium CG1_02_54_53]